MTIDENRPLNAEHIDGVHNEDLLLMEIVLFFMVGGLIVVGGGFGIFVLYAKLGEGLWACRRHWLGIVLLFFYFALPVWGVTKLLRIWLSGN